MRDLIKWVIIACLLFYAYQAGWFKAIGDYFSESAQKAKQEQVIHESDGSITTVRYKSFADVLMGR